MTITQIEKNLQNLISNFNQETFIYDLLLAYGTPKASIARLQNGNLNLFKGPGVVNWKKKVLFKEVFGHDLQQALTDLKSQAVNDQRFVIVTDYNVLVAWDTKTADTLEMEIMDLPKHLDFFLPWAGMEKAQYALENPADVKAAEKMARLYDEIKKDNPDNSPEFVHGLNVFLSRLLFCFFAEDTNIFKDKQFTGAIASHTQADGSDLNSYLDRLFEVLNTSKDQSSDLPNYLIEFPYVNGGLFRQKHPSPVFTRRSRQVIIDSGELDWSAINPDIFGSMIQAVITPEHRGGLGMHYTSVPNIMKVIEPLFLNELYEAFEAAKGNVKKLNELLNRLGKIKIFDPACGSGNFLIIAYKELRKLEILILKEKAKLTGKAGSGSLNFGGDFVSQISLSNFYGIELDDFAHEIAQLSLWLAEHQMNVEFFKEFGQTSPTLPLKESGNIVHGNACRIDWEQVCPKTPDSEICILGNPPYLGGKKLNKEQSLDMEIAGLSKMKQLDYICCWFIKASKFISSNKSKYAFVTTSSVCQGEQVPILWPYIFKLNQTIEFAYEPFLWSNNAKDVAGVACTILGIGNKNDSREKYLINEKVKIKVSEISPYLFEGEHTIIHPRSEPLSNLPIMVMGSNPVDGTNLILADDEYITLNSEFPSSTKFIKRYLGGNDFIYKTNRYCLWINDKDVDEAKKIPIIQDKLEKCRIYRLNAGRDAKKVADKPHRFCYRTHKDTTAIIFPKTTSSQREYIPCGITGANSIIYEAAFAIYNSEPYLIGVLSSKMHNLWLKITSGRLGMGYRYSVKLSYNTFPFPKISEERKNEITQCVFRILEEREKHPEKTLAELYDPNKMPAGLQAAHQANDEVIERCYRIKPFESDEERLEYLFKLYEKMIADEQTKGSLFEKEKKQSKKKKA